MIDTEIILRGNAAIEFHNNMMSADLEAIEARDSFVSNVDAYLDEQGVLTIDISNISVDLAVLDENSYEIEAVPRKPGCQVLERNNKQNIKDL